MKPNPIHFAILHASPLEPWQLLCIERLQALPAVTARVWIDSSAPHIVPNVAELRRQALDFILNFGSQPCPAELLDAARFGVWRFEFGAWSQPPGFWEVYEGHPVTSALLVRQHASADAVLVLKSGHLRTNLLSCKGNREQLLARFAHWPAQVCIDIRNGITDCFNELPLVTTTATRARPTRIQRTACACRIGGRIVRTVYRSLFRHDQWNIGVIDRPVASFLHSDHRARIRWLPAPARDEFRADPFGLIRNGKLTVLCEQFSYRDRRGIIVALEPGNAEAPTTVAIGPHPPVHLSYPFLLELDGRTLCVPETCAASEIGLYEAEHFPGRWKKVALLADSRAVVDATPFRHEGMWWLAGSEDAPKGATSELHLWYAQEIGGPWHAHAANPVKIDIRSARPGGTPFHVAGVLYRPAQDCARVYGARIVINRVEVLTPTEFREVPATLIEPDPAGPYPDGLHTLSGVGELTLIDARRLVFSAPEFRRVLRHFLRQALRRLRLLAR